MIAYTNIRPIKRRCPDMGGPDNRGLSKLLPGCMEMYLRAKTITSIAILTVAGLLFAGTKGE